MPHQQNQCQRKEVHKAQIPAIALERGQRLRKITKNIVAWQHYVKQFISVVTNAAVPAYWQCEERTTNSWSVFEFFLHVGAGASDRIRGGTRCNRQVSLTPTLQRKVALWVFECNFTRGALNCSDATAQVVKAGLAGARQKPSITSNEEEMQRDSPINCEQFTTTQWVLFKSINNRYLLSNGATKVG